MLVGAVSVLNSSAQIAPLHRVVPCRRPCLIVVPQKYEEIRLGGGSVQTPVGFCGLGGSSVRSNVTPNHVSYHVPITAAKLPISSAKLTAAVVKLTTAIPLVATAIPLVADKIQ